MAFYRDSDQLYNSLSMLFERIHSQGDSSAQAVSASRLVIRLRMTAPAGVVLINGRKSPPQITFGNIHMQPDLDIDLPADSLHAILLTELSLKKALVSGQMKVRGPVWKSYVLEDIFRQGQMLYPQVLKDQGLNGSQPAAK